MLGELLADRHSPARIRLDGAGVGRRRSRHNAEYLIHDKSAGFTGDVVVPFAVVLSTAAIVRKPPRGLPAGSVTRCISHP